MRGEVVRAAALALGGTLAVIAIGTACLALHLSLPAPLCLDLLVIILLSLGGSFVASAIVSMLAVGLLDYDFTAPLKSIQILDPADGLAVVLFLTAAAVVTTLVGRLRRQALRLAVTNARLQEQIAEVEHAQKQIGLARLNRVMLMGEMTASIAHEVNQPLTGILANAGTALRYLTREDPPLDMVRKSLDLVVRDGRRAGSVVSRVRELTRNEPPRVEPVDINTVVRNAVDFTMRDMQANGIDFETRLATGIPTVSADPVQIQQVVLNLIVNAIEAMSGQTNRLRSLVVVSGATDEAIFVEVRDSGTGLDAGAANRVFDSFFTTKPQGMGMGLSLSRSIVEAHGGRLTASDNAPAGAIFRFTLPLGQTHG